MTKSRKNSQRKEIQKSNTCLAFVLTGFHHRSNSPQQTLSIRFLNTEPLTFRTLRRHLPQLIWTAIVSTQSIDQKLLSSNHGRISKHAISHSDRGYEPQSKVHIVVILYSQPSSAATDRSPGPVGSMVKQHDCIIFEGKLLPQT